MWWVELFPRLRLFSSPEDCGRFCRLLLKRAPGEKLDKKKTQRNQKKGSTKKKDVLITTRVCLELEYALGSEIIVCAYRTRDLGVISTTL